MARKKIEPIVTLGADTDDLTVQKSLPLFSLWRSDLTLAEFKILDIYLSRINSHNPEKRVVVFEKGELEKALGVTKINLSDLKLRLKHLMGNVVEVPDKDSKKGFRLCTLFEEVEAWQDEETGLWTVKLECTQKAMKYFFNIENLGYLRYKLRCITSITSRYTYIMFIYLESNRYRKSWTVSIDELKKILDCDKEETYREFKFFNVKILKRVQKELFKKTECRYSYTPIKKGRRVAAIRFDLETLKDDIIQAPAHEPDQISNDLWKEPLEPLHLSKEQCDAVRAILVTIPDNRLPQSLACQGDRTLMEYHYLDQKVKLILANKRIKHPFEYLLKIMQGDSREQE